MFHYAVVMTITSRHCCYRNATRVRPWHEPTEASFRGYDVSDSFVSV